MIIVYNGVIYRLTKKQWVHLLFAVMASENIGMVFSGAKVIGDATMVPSTREAERLIAADPRLTRAWQKLRGN